MPAVTWFDTVWLTSHRTSWWLPLQAVFLPPRCSAPRSSLAPILEVCFIHHHPEAWALLQPPPLSPLSHLAILLPPALQTTSHFIRCFISKEGRSGRLRTTAFSHWVLCFVPESISATQLAIQARIRETPLVNSNSTSFTGVHSWMSCVSVSAYEMKWTWIYLHYIFLQLFTVWGKPVLVTFPLYPPEWLQESRRNSKSALFCRVWWWLLLTALNWPSLTVPCPGFFL